MAQNRGNGASLGDRLQQQASNQSSNMPAERKKPTTLAEYFDYIKPQIAEALPKHMTVDRLARIALTTIRTNPKLAECHIASLAAAVMQAAQLGLEPGLIGHCYIIPYGKEATFIIGYKGMIDLARRSGNIQSIAAHEVYENDHIVLEYGLEEKLEHIPWFLRKDQRFTQPGNIVGAYMVAKFKDGGHFIHYMPIHEIELHRKRSKASGNGPWVTDYTEMCKKTVVRSGWKWLPISIEQMAAVTRDESTARDITEVPDNDSIIDITASQGGAGEQPAPPQQPEEPPEQGDIEFEQAAN